MITNGAVEVHLGLRLLDGAADHTYHHNDPDIKLVWEL